MLYLFHLLYQEGSAIEAAKRLAISQPALSHRLNKLRKEFDDPLFVRGTNTLVPTPKAHAIATKVSRLISDIDLFYQDELRTPISEVNDIIHIYSTDYMESLLLPKLLPAMQSLMPKVQVVTHNTNGVLPRKMLENGQCDIAIAGFYNDLPTTFFQQKLAQEHMQVLVRAEHPIIQRTLTLNDYVACQHIVTTLTGDLNGMVDKALAKIGKKRHVVCGLSSFMVPAKVVSQTNYLLTCLNSVALQAMNEHGNLVCCEPPLELPAVTIYQIWHQRTHHDILRSQVRKLIHQILNP
ncbi:LysR family transcriptional regulator [Thalassotalea aquiviva]|uniref:LysR family transcriptional regulator n=1 Tax=Thalassotalea aquiviva TaxID=3242415 RepID=UPI00352B41BF